MTGHFQYTIIKYGHCNANNYMKMYYYPERNHCIDNREVFTLTFFDLKIELIKHVLVILVKYILLGNPLLEDSNFKVYTF